MSHQAWTAGVTSAPPEPSQSPVSQRLPHNRGTRNITGRKTNQRRCQKITDLAARQRRKRSDENTSRRNRWAAIPTYDDGASVGHGGWRRRRWWGKGGGELEQMRV